MNETYSTLIRSVLKIGAGVAVSKGLMSESQALEIIGALAGLIAVVWGIISANKAKAARTMALLLCASLSLGALTACSSARLASGGAYAPVDAQGQATTAPDLQLYQVDAAYRLAYQLIDTVFTFEKQNRDALWKISPQIKRTLDSLRPQAWQGNEMYLQARTAYLAHPTPAGLDTLATLLSRMEQLSAAAQAVIPSVTTTPN